jgi:threonine/homoserine/homoserine lactone efflux protein
MGALIVAYDIVYFSLLAFVVTRARAAFERGPWPRRLERTTGSVMIALGLRLAVER